MMFTTLITLTLRSLIGRRRVLVLALVPLLIVGLALFAMVVSSPSGDDIARTLLGDLGYGAVLPLLCIVTGTAVLGPDIDDGTIVYVLAKPVRRSLVILAKWIVAVGVALLFGVGSMAIAGVVLTHTMAGTTAAYMMAGTLATAGYCAVALMLAAMFRQAVAIGLGYAIVWEVLVAGFVPGVRTLSIRQWALSLTQDWLSGAASDAGIASEVRALTAGVLLIATCAASLYVATQRVRSLRMTDAG